MNIGQKKALNAIFLKKNTAILQLSAFFVRQSNRKKNKIKKKGIHIMKKFFVFVAAMFTLISCSAIVEKEEALIEETRLVDKFTQIQIMGSPTVIYTQGSKCSVRVKAPKSIVKKVSTVCKGNRLEIETKGGVNFWGFKGDSYDKVTVYVTSPDITGV